MTQARTDLIEQAYDGIIALYRSAKPQQTKVLQKLHLRRQQVQSLWYIYHNTGATAGEVGQHLQISKSSVTQLLDGLEARALVMRESNPADRRLVMIRLTPKAEHILKDFREEHLEHMKQHLSKLSDVELQVIAGIAGKVA